MSHEFCGPPAQQYSSCWVNNSATTPTENLHRQASGVRQNHSRCRHRLASNPHQRHSRTCRRSNRGTVSVEAKKSSSEACSTWVARPFRHEADNRKLAFRSTFRSATLAAALGDGTRKPSATVSEEICCRTLSSSTEEGGVRLSVFRRAAHRAWSPDHSRFSALRHRLSPSLFPTAELVFRPRNNASFSRPSQQAGCRDEPQVPAGNRSGSRHQPRTGQPASGGRDSVEQRPPGQKGARFHALSAAKTYVGPNWDRLLTAKPSSTRLCRCNWRCPLTVIGSADRAYSPTTADKSANPTTPPC